MEHDVELPEAFGFERLGGACGALPRRFPANATMEATGHPADGGFMDDQDDIFVTSPFQSDPWGDYKLSERARQGDDHLELEDPSRAYGRYVEWRDAFAAFADKVSLSASHSGPRA